MKGLKRVFALAVVFAMILSCVPAMAATKFVDVNEDDAVVVDVLTSLGIIQGYDENGAMYFKGDNTITRAEFAAVVTRLLGMEDSAKTQRDTIFTDVPASHWASGYITTAVDTNGIIVGMGDGTFQPEAPVTYEQAVKMLVCALGYETKALEEGTYPTGYIFVAKTIGLLDDVAGSVGQEAKRSTVAQLLYNALDIPLMQRILSGTTKSYYGVYDGEENSPRKTVMSEYLNIVKLVGKVTKNELSTGGREGIVSIDIEDNFSSRFAATNGIYKEGEVTDFAVGNTNAKDFIGYEVLAFATYTSSRTTDPTILAVQDNSKNGTKFTVDLDMIKDVTVSSSVTTITYYTDEAQSKTSKLYVASDAKDLSVFFNGLNEAGYTGANFKSDFEAKNMDEMNGTLELRSTKSDGAYDYDVMSFTIYETFVVDSVVGASTYKVYPIDENYYGKLSYIPFDPDDKDITTTIVDKNGSKVDPETLKQYDVLSVKVNDPLGKAAATSTKDKTVFDCTLVQDSIQGTITELANDNKVVIDGTEYELSWAGNDELITDLDLGDVGTFYLDASGKIAAYTKDSSKQGNYGVVLARGKSAGTSVSDYAQLKMYTPDGKLEVYDLADKVKLEDQNGESVTKTDSEALTAIEGKTLPLVVAYSTNAAGEINKISWATQTSASYNSNYYKNYDIYANILDTDGDILADNREEPSLKVAGKSYLMNDATKVIVFDHDSDSDTDFRSATLDEFDSYAGTDFTADVDDMSHVSVFNVNSNNYAGLVFIQSNIDNTADATGLALVKSVTNTTNSEDSEVSKYSVINSAAEGATSYVEGENYKGAAFVQGSIMIPGTVDANGEIKTATALTSKTGTYTDNDKEVAPFFGANKTYLDKWAADASANKTDVTYYFGKVTRKSSNTVYFDNELGYSGGKLTKENDTTLVIPSSKVALVYDARKNASNKVYADSASILSFTKINSNDEDYDALMAKYPSGYMPADATNDEPISYYIFAREYNGSLEDVVIYIYDGNVTVTSAGFAPENNAANNVNLDAVLTDDQDIIVED